MTVEKAKEIILKEFEFVKNSKEFSEIEIDFMGGEPFTNFDLIKEVTEWLDAMDPVPVPYILFASTNGTLLTDERKEWLKKHRKTLWLGASYDGSSSVQKLNRGVDVVDLEFFKEMWPEQPLQMTLSKASLDNMAENVISMLERGFRMEISAAQGVDWNEDDACKYYEQLNKLGAWYLEHQEYRPVFRMSHYLFVLDNPDEVPCVKDCGTGTAMVTYDVDGTAYGCHMFTPITMGKDRALELKNVNWDNPALVDDPYCKSCILKQICSTCPGFNYNYRQSLAIRDKTRCAMTMAEAKAATDYQLALMFLNKENLSPDAMRYAKAAIKSKELLQRFPLPGSPIGPYTP